MEFKVGQKVKVKQLIGGYNCEVTDLYINTDMEHCSGKITTIIEIDSDHTVRLKDCGGYWFSYSMINPVATRLKRK